WRGGCWRSERAADAVWSLHIRTATTLGARPSGSPNGRLPPRLVRSAERLLVQRPPRDALALPELLEHLAGHGTADVEALRLVALALAQEGELFGAFHALGDHLDLEVLRQVQHRLRDLGVMAVVADVLDEGLVDLHRVDGEVAE